MMTLVAQESEQDTEKILKEVNQFDFFFTSFV